MKEIVFKVLLSTFYFFLGAFLAGFLAAFAFLGVAAFLAATFLGLTAFLAFLAAGFFFALTGLAAFGFSASLNDPAPFLSAAAAATIALEVTSFFRASLTRPPALAASTL